jgi:hypothetical protein
MCGPWPMASLRDGEGGGEGAGSMVAGADRPLLEKMARASSLGSAAAGPAVGTREGSRSSSTPLNLKELGGDGKIP